jgi:hypothetical protein
LDLVHQTRLENLMETSRLQAPADATEDELNPDLAEAKHPNGPVRPQAQPLGQKNWVKSQRTAGQSRAVR